MSRETVGFIGLGLMGAQMAGRLQERGFPLVLYNRTGDKAAPLLAKGANRADSPAALARRCPIIGLMVTDGSAVRELCAGETGLAAGLGPGKLVINFSTVGIQAAREEDGLIRATGAAYLDAPVLGSVKPAANGELIVFAGGESTALERARPVLEALSTRVYHVGPAGQGSALKLIANMLLARYVEALGDVLSLSRCFGLEPGLVIDAIQSGALASPMWDKGKILLEGPPPLHFPLRSMVKDLRLLDEETERSGINLPVQEAVFERFLEALQSGLGDRDYSELARPV
jgi:3-hydroxyisobutyrate dehydrogenase-like beta-hydroxyacid dehydrogenase